MAYRDKSETQERGFYPYKKCLPCRVKVHIDSLTCWKCGEKVENDTYGRDDPNDAIYSQRVNRGDVCVTCPVTQRGKTCKYTFCFATGKGKCDLCREYEGTRFDCCQKVQKINREYSPPTEKQLETVRSLGVTM